MVLDSPQLAQRYIRSVSRDYSTVRRFSTTPADVSNISPLSRKPSSLKGIRSRKHARKRSSISSTLTRVLILNVRDLLRVPDPNDNNDEVCFLFPLLTLSSCFICSFAYFSSC